MDKKIVLIDVGSTIKCEIVSDGRYRIVTSTLKEIDLINGWLEYEGEQHTISFNYILESWNDMIEICGVPVSEIEDIRIKGYNDKVELKVGDSVCTLGKFVGEHNSLIREISDGKILRNNELTSISLWESYYWLINGKKYLTEDIILPTTTEGEKEIIVDKKDKELRFYLEYCYRSDSWQFMNRNIDFDKFSNLIEKFTRVENDVCMSSATVHGMEFFCKEQRLDDVLTALVACLK